MSTMVTERSRSAGYAYATNPEFDTQVTNQKFIFIFGLKKNSGVKIQDSESNRYAKSLVQEKARPLSNIV
ncbi:hypothetical protein [Nostoc sp. DedQUE09]|uniref:hypothetical protein n=1 Tax=Nostoc sp. DedQUE09 TaxID=3075394 RepID=UPI002AD465D3|nr:hypothetical protein [Nostoc sp. DedQUE09]MDZ7954600.1 hypothetical protein [Nostoc sp. DedQUE09]